MKWCDAKGQVLPIPVATLNCVLLGPGTSVTHDAVRTMASAGAAVCWVGEDSLLFYATGISPTSNSRNLRQQAKLSCDPKMSLAVARRLFSRRFPEADLEGKTLKEMMGMEGRRMRDLYEQKASEYKVGWSGRSYVPGRFEMSDLTNKMLTSANGRLYALVSSCVSAVGLSPHLGFIHSGSPLPFVYDLADLYKEHHCVDLAFSLTQEAAGRYERELLLVRLRERMIASKLVETICKDMFDVLQLKDGNE